MIALVEDLAIKIAARADSSKLRNCRLLRSENYIQFAFSSRRYLIFCGAFLILILGGINTYLYF